MNVLIVCASFYPTLNGAVIYFDSLSRELARSGHDVTIVCSGDTDSVEYLGRVKLVRYPRPPRDISPRKQYVWYRDKSLEKIVKIDSDFDFVLGGSEIFLKDLVGRFGREKVFWVVPSLRNIARNIGNKEEEIVLLRKSIKEAIAGINLIVVSESLKGQFKKEFDRVDGICVVNPGVDVGMFNVSDGSGDGILYLGRISKEKNLLSGVSAFEKTSSGKLSIVGDGPELEKVKKYVELSPKKELVEFFGSTKETAKYYSSAKVFVLPSKYESFGITILEAMASGLPVVAFRPDGEDIITASDGIIEDGITGFLVGDEKEMAGKIDLLLKDDKLWKKMSVAARKEAEKYSWGRAADEILRFVGVKS